MATIILGNFEGITAYYNNSLSKDHVCFSIITNGTFSHLELTADEIDMVIAELEKGKEMLNGNDGDER